MNYTYGIVTRLKEEFDKANEIVPFDKFKTRKRPHMQDIAIRKNNIQVYEYLPDAFSFEIGNRDAEEYTPHYHILEDAQKIKNPTKGTKETKGSQEQRKYKYSRDYGRVSYRVNSKGEKILHQEYRDSKFRDKLYEEGTYRENKHYQWIERLLESVVDDIATKIGAELKREESGLNIRDNTLRYGR